MISSSWMLQLALARTALRSASSFFLACSVGFTGFGMRAAEQTGIPTRALVMRRAAQFP
jgi:hypothetical protein